MAENNEPQIDFSGFENLKTNNLMEFDRNVTSTSLSRPSTGKRRSKRRTQRSRFQIPPSKARIVCWMYSVKAARDAGRIWRMNLAQRTQRRQQQYLMARKMIEEHKVDGDIKYYTPTNLRVREHNRHNPKIVAALTRWWDEVVDDEKRRTVSRAAYFEMYSRLINTLAPYVSIEQRASIFEMDWRRDAGSDYAEFMKKRQFLDATYQLADTWVDSLDPDKYVRWINSLYPKVATSAKHANLRLKATNTTLINRLEEQLDRQGGRSKHSRRSRMASNDTTRSKTKTSNDNEESNKMTESPSIESIRDQRRQELLRDLFSESNDHSSAELYNSNQVFRQDSGGVDSRRRMRRQRRSGFRSRYNSFQSGTSNISDNEGKSGPSDYSAVVSMKEDDESIMHPSDGNGERRSRRHSNTGSQVQQRLQAAAMTLRSSFNPTSGDEGPRTQTDTGQVHSQYEQVWKALVGDDDDDDDGSLCSEAMRFDEIPFSREGDYETLIMNDWLPWAFKAWKQIRQHPPSGGWPWHINDVSPWPRRRAYSCPGCLDGFAAVIAAQQQRQFALGLTTPYVTRQRQRFRLDDHADESIQLSRRPFSAPPGPFTNCSQRPIASNVSSHGNLDESDEKMECHTDDASSTNEQPLFFGLENVFGKKKSRRRKGKKVIRNDDRSIITIADTDAIRSKDSCLSSLSHHHESTTKRRHRRTHPRRPNALNHRALSAQMNVRHQPYAVIKRSSSWPRLPKSKTLHNTSRNLNRSYHDTPDQKLSSEHIETFSVISGSYVSLASSLDAFSHVDGVENQSNEFGEGVVKGLRKRRAKRRHRRKRAQHQGSFTLYCTEEDTEESTQEDTEDEEESIASIWQHHPGQHSMPQWMRQRHHKHQKRLKELHKKQKKKQKKNLSKSNSQSTVDHLKLSKSESSKLASKSKRYANSRRYAASMPVLSEATKQNYRRKYHSNKQKQRRTTHVVLSKKDKKMRSQLNRDMNALEQMHLAMDLGMMPEADETIPGSSQLAASSNIARKLRSQLKRQVRSSARALEERARRMSDSSSDDVGRWEEHTSSRIIERANRYRKHRTHRKHSRRRSMDSRTSFSSGSTPSTSLQRNESWDENDGSISESFTNRGPMRVHLSKARKKPRQNLMERLLSQTKSSQARQAQQAANSDLPVAKYLVLQSAPSNPSWKLDILNRNTALVRRAMPAQVIQAILKHVLRNERIPPLLEQIIIEYFRSSVNYEESYTQNVSALHSNLAAVVSGSSTLAHADLLQWLRLWYQSTIETPPPYPTLPKVFRTLHQMHKLQGTQLDELTLRTMNAQENLNYETSIRSTGRQLGPSSEHTMKPFNLPITRVFDINNTLMSTAQNITPSRPKQAKHLRKTDIKEFDIKEPEWVHRLTSRRESIHASMSHAANKQSIVTEFRRRTLASLDKASSLQHTAQRHKEVLCDADSNNMYIFLEKAEKERIRKTRMDRSLAALQKLQRRAALFQQTQRKILATENQTFQGKRDEYNTTHPANSLSPLTRSSISPRSEIDDDYATTERTFQLLSSAIQHKRKCDVSPSNSPGAPADHAQWTHKSASSDEFRVSPTKSEITPMKLPLLNGLKLSGDTQIKQPSPQKSKRHSTDLQMAFASSGRPATPGQSTNLASDSNINLHDRQYVGMIQRKIPEPCTVSNQASTFDLPSSLNVLDTTRKVKPPDRPIPERLRESPRRRRTRPSNAVLQRTAKLDEYSKIDKTQEGTSETFLLGATPWSTSHALNSPNELFPAD